MTKMEMVNRMIVLGCIKEDSRNRWMRRTKEEVMIRHPRSPEFLSSLRYQKPREEH